MILPRGCWGDPASAKLLVLVQCRDVRGVKSLNLYSYFYFPKHLISIFRLTISAATGTSFEAVISIWQKRG